MIYVTIATEHVSKYEERNKREFDKGWLSAWVRIKKQAAQSLLKTQFLYKKDDEVHEESLLWRSDAEELLIPSANRRKANSTMVVKHC